VKKPEAPRTSEHCSDLLLPYVDGLLGPADEHMVEEHLKQCPQCSSEADDIRETATLLGRHKEAFCPELWELYEFLHHGRDPDGTVGEHLERCNVCQEFRESLAPKTVPEQMPDHVRAGLKARLPGLHDTVADPVSPTESLWERAFGWFKFPALAAGAVAAVLLAVVLLRSPDMPQSVIALSSVAWEKAPKPKAIQATGGRAAIALVFKNFDPPMGQSYINALYDKLTPTMAVYERFSMVPPDKFREAIDSQDREITDTRQLVERVGKRLNLTACLVITVTSRSGNADVKLDLIDIDSGNVRDHATVEQIPFGDLESRIRESALSVLQASGTGR
jgi:anti-sigma factor RsiW